MKTTIRAATLLLMLALAACAAPGGTSVPSASSSVFGETEPARSFAPAPSASVEDTNDGDAPEGIPAAVWTAILADLADRLGEPVSDPEVITATPMTWNDGSLGCPEPGQGYTQALVDGYHVVLEVEGERYDYRIGSGTLLKLCEGGVIEGG
jgi:hypothetical protein